MNRSLLTLMVGIGIGILLAPDKGSATIRKLRNKLQDWKDNSEDEVDELVQKGKRAYRDGKSDLSEAID